MSDFDDQQNDDASDDDQSGPAALRAAAERGRQAERERDDAHRQLAFIRAGVDIDSPIGQLVLKGYTGDLETEAIRAFATDVGAIRPPVAETPPPPSVPPAERAQQDERASLAADAADPTEIPDPDPYEAGYQAFDKRVKAGARREDAAAEVFDRVFDAAAKGDKRVLFDPQRWREEQGVQ